MPYSMAPLLIHSQAVPEGARDALRAAQDASPHERREILASAGRILVENGVDCEDVQELLDLPSDDDCGCDDA
jgi:hypothetical protein